MVISVVICTFNRGAHLERAVASVASQATEAGACEIVVVDNASTDDTPRQVARLRERFACVRYVLEPNAGLSHARNRGMAEATGDWVAYIDDDAEALPGWLAAVRAVATEASAPEAIGGRIHVRWPEDRPEWLPARLESYFGHCDFGPSRRRLAFPEYPFGSNMIFRAAVLRELGGFHATLGRKGTSLLAGEEAELFKRLGRAGGRVVYEPAAEIAHWISPAQVTKWWVLRRAHAHGRTSYLLQCLHDPPSMSILVGRLGRASTRWAIAIGSSIVATLALRPAQVRLGRLANTCYWAGVIQACVTQTLWPRRDA